MKILHPTTIGFQVAPTRFTATSSTPRVFSSVLSKKRLHPTITGILDSHTSSTVPSSDPGLNLSVLLKNRLPPTILGILEQPYKPPPSFEPRNVFRTLEVLLGSKPTLEF
ncbi:hypothetical protein QL285_014372 [Trifolium repens]|nr:hypothetical protein QL285_014370 [Trifolium repens]KAK2443251.1 hypothetical protein QL285_014372 [Trifolium repens]